MDEILRAVKALQTADKIRRRYAGWVARTTSLSEISANTGAADEKTAKERLNV